MGSQPKLKVQNVSMKYLTNKGETNALANLSFTVDDGEFVSIVGPSGCGKSTLLSIIAGLIKPTSGSVSIDGELVSKPGQHVGYMLQQDFLFEWRTILQNAMLGLEIQGKSAQGKQRVLKLLSDYGLGNFHHYYPRQLSGGMRQRAALARTLAVNPDILLLDEPFSALDYQTRLTIEGEVSKILKKEQKTTLLVTHDIAEAISMSDRVIVLSNRPGKIKNIHTIQLSCKEKTPFTTRQCPEFGKYINQIWEELDIHV